jgi:hypothetical protein
MDPQQSLKVVKVILSRRQPVSEKAGIERLRSTV